MSGSPQGDRRSARRQETKDEIVAAAWDLVRREGLAALSMRDLGSAVGMKAQSIYSYFASKHEIYDAMFEQGYRQFIASLEASIPPGLGPVDVVRAAVRHFFDFCVADPVRYQLLFQRTIPGFEPSPASWAVALESYDRLRDAMAQLGVTEQADLDMYTAVLTGLTDQQISNDPGGTRWAVLVDRATDMLLREIAPEHLQRSTT
jgi:AcrR family transcriptional regulator